jgi:hypothetical protein
MFKNNYARRRWNNTLLMILAPLMGFMQLQFSIAGDEPGGGTSEGEDKLLAKIKEQNKEALKNSLDEAVKEFQAKIEEAKEGNLSVDDFEEFKKSIKDKLDGSDFSGLKEEVDKLNQTHKELHNTLVEQGKEMAKLRTSTEDLSKGEKKAFEKLSRKGQFKYLLEKGMETEEFKGWSDKNMIGQTPRMDAKAVTGLAADHTGTIFITEPVDNVRDIPREQPHMRDYLTVNPTDETDITFPEVYNYTDIYTLGTQMLTENEEITDVTFKSKEQTSKVVRMGVSMNVSKRYFRGRSAVIINHVLAQLPDALMFKEDVQILHGDGSGSNLNGIITDAREFDLTPSTYAAGAFTSIATYDSGTRTLVTFTAAHGLLSGDKLQIANSTGGTYDKIHEDILLIDETKVVINQAYTLDANVLANWTGTGISYWYQRVDEAQEFDVLSAAASILEAGLYNANIIFVNPQTIKRIGTLKGTDAHYVGVSRDAAGRLNLDGIPIVSIPVIPAGWFLIGDFSEKNIEIRQYTTMAIQFLEDVTTNKQNAVVVLADEEFHLVKYNPNWYIYDRFSTSVTQLETPAS